MKTLKYLAGPIAVALIFVLAVAFRAAPVPSSVEILTDVTMTDTTTATSSFNTVNFPRFSGDESLKVTLEAVVSSGSPTIVCTLQGTNFPTSDGLWRDITTFTVDATEDTTLTVTYPDRYMRWSYSSTGSHTTVINNALQVK